MPAVERLQQIDENSPPLALITGGGRDRIGRVIARDLAAQGYRVVLHYHRSQAAAEEGQREIQEQGGLCEIIQADLTSAAETDRMFRTLREQFPRLDVLVSTASIYNPCPLEEITEEELLRNFQVNTAGSFWAARAAGLWMAEQETGGSIVLFGDAALDLPYCDHAAYFVSKGSIPTLTRVLAVELAARNPRVRVNAIQPGPVLFPPQASEQERQELVAGTLVKNADCPDMVAHAVRFLVENQFVTGTLLPLDGGRNLAPGETMHRHQ